jgi:ppGpp synthetase/RelA/SpoT-type nucleotidyltranferase
MTNADTASWLKAQVTEYTRLRSLHQQLSDLLDHVLRRTAAQRAPLAIIQTRTKSVSSFAEKCLRKQHKYAMPAHQLTDLCGARVVVRTLGELHDLSDAIERTFDVDWENSLDVARRLQSSEFGYRSVHYVVALRPDVDVGEDVPPELLGFDCSACGTRHQLKAEIQVRTTVQHAWADFAHDLTYKGAFPLPEQVKREIAVVAAELEDVDQAFARIQGELRSYTASYGGYLTEDELRDERDLLDTVHELTPDDESTALRSARLSMRLGDWQRATGVLERFSSEAPSGPSSASILRDLGICLCKLGGATEEDDRFKRGQELLERSVAIDPGDRDALASLAGTWKGIDDEQARALYLRALELDPADYYALGNLVDQELANPGAAPLLTLLQPLLAGAVERCRAHAQLGINVPWSLFDLGRFHLLCGEPYESLHAYALGLCASSAAYMIRDAADALDKIRPTASALEGFEWARRLLIVGEAARFPSDEALAAVQAISTPDALPLSSPVVIVGGGTAAGVEAQMRSYHDLLLDGLSAFDGSLISGGTSEGVSGVVADVAEHLARPFRLIGYVPRALPDGATLDPRYDELRATSGSSFSPLEPLQNWVDLIASGIPPSAVRMLGINGGRIAAVEFRIAAGLGAAVGLMEESGRESARLLADVPWMESATIVPLPADADTVRAFVTAGGGTLDAEVIETLAHTVHRTFVERAAMATTTDPSLREWDDLPEELRESNRDQARHYADVLRPIGCTIEPVEGRPVARMTFTPDEVEGMSKAEHGRWVVERLLNGWRWGADRDAEHRTSPYLVPWDQLTDEVKEVDRVFVRQMPEILATAGLEIRRSTIGDQRR